MSSSAQAPHPVPATLGQIAAWDLDHLSGPQHQFEIKASVPALQRGLVWSPQQVELLWDSILRGFPIGSFVVGQNVSKQERSSKAGLTHHLLDGQQRCNAIALGFHDPFADNSGSVRGNVTQSILWLDIAPGGIAGAPPEFEAASSQIPVHSTREFLTRVTTKAHPWGYAPDDDASRLSAKCCRDAIAWVFASPKNKRPEPAELLPWRSNAPVPMAWLIEAADAASSSDKFWEHVRQRLLSEDKKLQAASRKHRWTQLALLQIDSSSAVEYLEYIHQSIRRAYNTQVVVIVSPSDLLNPSRQEVASGHESNISNIEHLFHRCSVETISQGG